MLILKAKEWKVHFVCLLPGPVNFNSWIDVGRQSGFTAENLMLANYRFFPFNVKNFSHFLQIKCILKLNSTVLRGRVSFIKGRNVDTEYGKKLSKCNVFVQSKLILHACKSSYTYTCHPCLLHRKAETEICSDCLFMSVSDHNSETLHIAANI